MTEVLQLTEPLDAKRPGATNAIWTKVFDWDKERWRDQAACLHVDPELFFPVGTTGIAIVTIDAAKAVCRSCPVRDACLQFALETKQEDGVWGGTDEAERRRLRRTWRAGRRGAAAQVVQRMNTGHGPAPRAIAADLLEPAMSRDHAGQAFENESGALAPRGSST